MVCRRQWRQILHTFVIIVTLFPILFWFVREGIFEQNLNEGKRSTGSTTIRNEMVKFKGITSINSTRDAKSDLYTFDGKGIKLLLHLKDRLEMDPRISSRKLESYPKLESENVNGSETSQDLLLESDPNFTIDQWVSDVDPHDYPYIINPKDKCKAPPGIPDDILLVICVLSAPKNKERRGVIRKTYGNESIWEQSVEGVPMVRLVFMLGATQDGQLQREIQKESALYGDIVQEGFVDSYLNLTRKTVMILKWVTLFCRNAVFMMKVDDDVILNVNKVMTFLLLSPPDDFTAGARSKRSRVMRRKDLKYYTPKHVYNLTHYEPYYMGGAGYFLSLDVADRILEVALRKPLFPWEDIFITTCMRDLGIPILKTEHFAWGRFTVSNGRLIDDVQCERFNQTYLVATGLPAKHMLRLWMYTQQKIH